MGYKATKRTRVAVPGKARRTVYIPPTERTWITGALADAAIIIVSTLATTLFLLFISGQIYDTTSGNLTWSPARQEPTSAQQTPQPSPLARPSPTAQASPFLATPTPAAPEGGATVDVPDDAAIQAAIDKRIADDPTLSKLDITATVTGARVILVGTVPTTELKTQVEKLVRAVKGVKEVDNQIVVVSPT